VRDAGMTQSKKDAIKDYIKLKKNIAFDKLW
jgi:hypothetical protein